MGIVLGLLTIPFLLCGGLLIIGAVNQAPQRAANRATATKLTAANFQRIRIGMTSKEVTAILGDPNDINSEIQIGDLHYLTASWDAGEFGSCSVTFSGGKVHSKVQFGLK